MTSTMTGATAYKIFKELNIGDLLATQSCYTNDMSYAIVVDIFEDQVSCCSIDKHTKNCECGVCYGKFMTSRITLIGHWPTSTGNITCHTIYASSLLYYNNLSQLT